VLVPRDIASVAFVSCIVIGGLVVYLAHKFGNGGGRDVFLLRESQEWRSGIDPWSGAVCLAAFFAITCALASWRPTNLLHQSFKNFWVVGSTVYGGGNVVIPFLLTMVVDAGWIPESVFMSGFGLVGCFPGPFYNIVPFIGAVMYSWRGAVFAACGVFLPPLLLTAGVLPFWDKLRDVAEVRVFLRGVNAAAAGLVLTGVWMLMHRIWRGPLSFAISMCAVVASVAFKVTSLRVFAACGVAGAVLVSAGVGGPYR
jgi:chromate transporter